MIKADLHTHTRYSHGADSPKDMYAAAVAAGLEIIGFSEHSPRPEGFTYRREYRDQLKAHLPDYFREVRALRENARPGEPRALLAMEMDWLDGEEDFIRNACQAEDFDYLIGSVHFLGHWGFDDGDEPWRDAGEEQCAAWYEEYFTAWEAMLASGLFQIAAHPDLIKIYSSDRFHAWLARPESRARVRRALTALADTGMAMEVSSAGLRKACREIYPAPPIMELAAGLGIPVTFASDAHSVRDVARDFDRLADYARRFGYTRQALFERGQRAMLPF